MTTGGPTGPQGPVSGAPGSTPSKPVAKASVVRFKAALRKARRRNQRDPEIDFLNITAMLDLMTIILVFVLKSLASSTASIPQSDDLTLPKSTFTLAPSEEGVVIRISKTQIVVGDNSEPVAEYSSREQLAQSGLDARYKQSGPQDLYIVPLAKVLSNYRETDKRLKEATGKDASTSEAIIVADETTPYRLLFEVLYTCGQSEFGRYHLMVLTGKKKG
jgi:biopolymer transport protein ExbD